MFMQVSNELDTSPMLTCGGSIAYVSDLSVVGFPCCVLVSALHLQLSTIVEKPPRTELLVA